MASVRLQNQRTKVIVRVDEATAATLDHEWKPVGASGAAPTPDKRPNKAATRAEWAAWASSVGIEPGDLTKGDLIAAVEAAETTTPQSESDSVPAAETKAEEVPVNNLEVEASKAVS